MKRAAGAGLAVVAIATAVLCFLKLWYLPQPNGDLQVSYALGIIISIVLAIVGRGMFHDRSVTRQ